ncbi:MAG TPA: Gfo/Idh/MocA family oxidoreductase [Fimbriimonas sp.]|nr:Gfo/Idh/MocA family oxidoreductase [Fimbriimonas sp.]
MPKIGWAGVGHIHTPAFVNEAVKRGFECAGVYDSDPGTAEKNAEKLTGQVFDLASLVANGEADAYVVTSQTVQHVEIVSVLAPTGKPIFVEKPIGVSQEASTELHRLLTENKNLFHTGYFQRGSAEVQTLKHLVDAGFFGQITRVRASVCHSGALGGWFDGEWGWMADTTQAGVGAFGDLGTHGLDLLLWLFGSVKAATGVLSNGTNRYGCDETGEGLLKFTNGTIGTLTAAWDDVCNPMRLQISGTEGHATLNGSLLVAGKDGKLAAPAELQPAVPSGFNAFLDAISGSPAQLISVSEATQRDVVMDAIYRGAKSQTWIEIPTEWQ